MILIRLIFYYDTSILKYKDIGMLHNTIYKDYVFMTDKKQQQIYIDELKEWKVVNDEVYENSVLLQHLDQYILRIPISIIQKYKIEAYI